jgi:predicted O-linked N-acetylglucosamine transferase (SPINDLY family)
MTPFELQTALDQGLQHHRAGRLADAERAYRQVLSQAPNHPQAWHLLGIVAHQVGQGSMAVDLIRRAISFRPAWPEAYSDLGEALRAAGRLDEAVAACRRAIELNPANVEAHHNLSVALTQQGQYVEAIAAANRAIALRPGFAEVYNALGTALFRNRRLDEAIAAYERAIALAPNLVAAYSNLGLALNEKGQLDRAIDVCRRAIALQPGHVEAYLNLALALKNKGQGDQAVAAYRQAIALQPNCASAYSNLGHVLTSLGRLDEAIAALRQALALEPGYAPAHNNLGNALCFQGRVAEGVASFRQAAALRPEAANIHSNWVYTLLFDPQCDAATQGVATRAWARKHADPLRQYRPAHSNDRNPQRRLRIGYVSPDFWDHVIGRNLLPLFRQHDRREFEITCYAQVCSADSMTGEFQNLADRWRSTIGLSDEELAAHVRADGIDILVDLSMHLAGNRLLSFARKPAPVQVTFAAYPGTTGLDAVDYRLSDPFLDPEGSDVSVYSETTIRLPHSFWCYDPLNCSDLSVGELPALESGVISFGCLSNFGKISPATLDVWASVMSQVPQSRLMLLAHPGSHRQATLDHLSSRGIEPTRIEFFSPQGRRDYMQVYRRIDIGLDSLPYNGHNTSLESLWMGVPVVTLVGKTVVGRAGFSQLSNLNLTELAACTPEEFVRIASALAHDLPRLKGLRADLRQRMEQSPLMDAAGFARGIESAYRQMWRKWCADNGAAAS